MNEDDSKLKLTISNTKIEDKEFISVCILNENVSGFRLSTLLVDLGESLCGVRNRVYFDFTAVNFMDSSCLGSLSNINEVAKNNGTDVRFSFKGNPLDVITVAGFDEVLTLV